MLLFFSTSAKSDTNASVQPFFLLLCLCWTVIAFVFNSTPFFSCVCLAKRSTHASFAVLISWYFSIVQHIILSVNAIKHCSMNFVCASIRFWSNTSQSSLDIFTLDKRTFAFSFFFFSPFFLRFFFLWELLSSHLFPLFILFICHIWARS